MAVVVAVRGGGLAAATGGRHGNRAHGGLQRPDSGSTVPYGFVFLICFQNSLPRVILA